MREVLQAVGEIAALLCGADTRAGLVYAVVDPWLLRICIGVVFWLLSQLLVDLLFELENSITDKLPLLRDFVINCDMSIPETSMQFSQIVHFLWLFIFHADFFFDQCPALSEITSLAI